MNISLRALLVTISILWLLMLRGYAGVAPYFIVHLANGSNLVSDDEVFIVIKGTNLVTGASCFVQFDQNGIGTLADVYPSTDPSLYSYPLAAFPLFSATAPSTRTIQLPLIKSARIYFSIKYPLYLPITVNNLGVATITEPTPGDPGDPAYRILYDKVEVNYQTITTGEGLKYQSFVNPTAVDFFCLPLGLFQTGDTSPDALTNSGLTESRETILSQVQGMLSPPPSPGLDKSYDNVWKRLFVDYTDPSGTEATLRVLSPVKSIVVLPSIQTSADFDDYFLTNGNPPGSGSYEFNYIDTVWNYYSTTGGNNTLVIDCTELLGPPQLFPVPPLAPLGSYTFTGQVDSATGNFIFTNADSSYQVVVAKPTDSYPFFAGASFTESCCGTPPCPIAPDANCSVNNTPGGIIVRQLSSAFVVGLLPAPNNTTVNAAYFKAQQSTVPTTYYTNDPCLNTPPSSTC
ncbi:MAG TPA: beta-1,3-glucanase family protein, partial [Opitutales bacterium]|nr:beta-1,3-glucanase family protein [Opitutales bacterium]